MELGINLLMFLVIIAFMVSVAGNLSKIAKLTKTANDQREEINICFPSKNICFPSKIASKNRTESKMLRHKSGTIFKREKSPME